MSSTRTRASRVPITSRSRSPTGRTPSSTSPARRRPRATRSPMRWCISSTWLLSARWPTSWNRPSWRTRPTASRSEGSRRSGERDHFAVAVRGNTVVADAISSDSLHTLLFLEPGEIDSSRLALVERYSEPLATPFGYLPALPVAAGCRSVPHSLRLGSRAGIALRGRQPPRASTRDGDRCTSDPCVRARLPGADRPRGRLPDSRQPHPAVVSRRLPLLRTLSLESGCFGRRGSARLPKLKAQAESSRSKNDR